MNDSTLEDRVLNLGSSVTVTDPCYIPSSLGHMAIEIPITPGEYDSYIEMSDEGSWGTRVSKLGITRNGFYQTNSRVVGYAGVDSGQMMIIDTDAISDWDSNDDDEWPFGIGAEPETPEIKNDLSYYAACEKTLGPEQSGILDELAVVSSSGYGDGSYPVWVYEDSLGNVERVEIRFIEDFEDEDNWEDDWDEEEEELDDEW